MDRLVSQARGYYFAVLASVREDLYCDQLFTCLVSCLLTWLTLSACRPVSVMYFVNLATQNLRSHNSSSRSSMLSLLRTTDRASGQLHGPGERQAGEKVLLRSDHPARGRATKSLTSCPQLTSHDRTLDDASSSSGRQTEKKMLGSSDRSSTSLQNARAIQNTGYQFSSTRAQPRVETISKVRFAEGL